MKKKAAPKAATPRAAIRKPQSHPVGSQLVSQPIASLFNRVASILDAARGSVVRAVNSRMVLAYWLIGREIVQELQGGDERAEYGKRVLSTLSRQLTQRYGQGYSLSNIKDFKMFYTTYPDRLGSISHAARGLFDIIEPAGSTSEHQPPPFHPCLSWTHYRTLMRQGRLPQFFSHFNRWFLRTMGQTPSAYRQGQVGERR